MHRAGIGPSPSRKPRPHSPSRSKGPARTLPNSRPINYVNALQSDSDSNDTLDEDDVQKKV